MKICSLIVFSSLMLALSHQAFAQDSNLAPPSYDNPTATSAATAASAATSGASAISGTNSLMSAAPSVLGSATGSSATGKIGALVNTAEGAANLYQAEQEYGQCSSNNETACAMAAVHFAIGMGDFAQAAQDMQSADAASNTGANVSNPNGSNSSDTGTGTSTAATATPNPGPTPYGDGSASVPTAFINAMTNAPPGSAFSYDPSKGTVTTSSGQVIPAGGGGAAGLAQAGVPQSVISDIMASEKKIDADTLKKYAALVNAAEEGSTGGGGGDAAAKSDTEGAAGGAGRGLASAGKKDPTADRAAQVAGMQKDYNGQPIGVAGDSIFSMMSRRYKLKESQSSFLTDAELLKK